ncbi:MAG: hypothetical protein RR356_00345 [Bacteroidales bacterium]
MRPYWLFITSVIVLASCDSKVCRYEYYKNGNPTPQSFQTRINKEADCVKIKSEDSTQNNFTGYKLTYEQ